MSSRPRGQHPRFGVYGKPALSLARRSWPAEVNQPRPALGRAATDTDSRRTRLLPPQKAKTPLGEVVASFLAARTSQVSAHSHRTDRDNLAALPAKLKARPIGSVSEADVLGFLTDQLKIKGRSTVARTRTTLSALFTYAMREKYVAAHPVRGVDLPPGASQKPADEWFTAESLAATLAAQRAASAHYVTITEWTSLTGLRWSETRALRVADLQDVPFPAVWVRRAQSEGYDEKAPKTANGERAVPLTDRARQLAREAAAGKRPEAHLFTSPKGRQLRMNLYRRFTRWSMTAPRKRPHMLRHYCASQWLRAGVPINQVAEWLGDDPRTVLKVYAHVLGEQQTIEGLRRLNELSSGPPRDPRDIPENANDHAMDTSLGKKTGSDQPKNGGDGGI
ncbi:tyrosine-type recombinase/integrase [Microbacterium sp. W1N]|uniref:tyrosine-type recombinase/integrase n=1 Tax=Microbacterium festucae TaxID=2977531 RepID=UPI0021BE59EE|nr:tyrosine-type recombinase/integrase [Microbacterium festucae]MCT9819832.1 tyrosine-type recombinase/integrase [Microbacterium festucae]